MWFTGLFLLPRLFISRHPGAIESGKVLFYVMTPAAAVAVVLGMSLILGFGFEGAWLPAKLAAVSLAILLHLYLGTLLVEIGRGAMHRSLAFYRALNWGALLLFLVIVGLSVAKPGAVPPLGGT